MQEAAKAFGATSKAPVNVAAGPTPVWTEGRDFARALGSGLVQLGSWYLAHQQRRVLPHAIDQQAWDVAL